MPHYFDTYHPDFQKAVTSLQRSGGTKKTASLQ